MWIWLTISLLLVIACITFGIHYFRNNRALQKSISQEPAYQKNKEQSSLTENDFPVVQQQNFSNLKMKLKSIEGNSVLHIQQLNALQKRIEALEGGSNFKEDDDKWDESREDWEKLYYVSRREKEVLENEVDITKEDLGEARQKLEELEKQQADWTAIKSDMEARLNEVHSLEETVEQLKRKLEGAANREKELEQQIVYEKYMHVEYELLKQQNNQLLIETEELNSKISEINSQNIIMEQKIKRLTELESNLEISEYEKQEIKSSVEQIFIENASLSRKLQQQYKYIEDNKNGDNM